MLIFLFIEFGIPSSFDSGVPKHILAWFSHRSEF